MSLIYVNRPENKLVSKTCAIAREVQKKEKTLELGANYLSSIVKD